MKSFISRPCCRLCLRDLSEIVYIECSVCPETAFCAECFSGSPEVKEHLPEHSYKVIPVLDFSARDTEWKVRDELHFLECSQICGMGNWEGISENMQSKTKEEVFGHFCRVYEEEDIESSYLGPDIKGTFSNPVKHQITGYMPLRKNFETEYENEAESKIKDINFNKEDTEFDTGLKLAVFEWYKTIVSKRKSRYEFAEKRTKFEMNPILAQDKKRTRKSRDFLARFNSFSRFMTKEDYEAFVWDFETEESLTKEIEALIQLQAARNSVKAKDPETLKGYDKNKRVLKCLDIDGLEGADILSKSEKNLCMSARIHPKEYIKCKKKMILVSSEDGGIKRGEAREIFKMDVNKIGKMYDFFLAAGWIFKKE